MPRPLTTSTSLPLCALLSKRPSSNEKEQKAMKQGKQVQKLNCLCEVCLPSRYGRSVSADGFIISRKTVARTAFFASCFCSELPTSSFFPSFYQPKFQRGRQKQRIQNASRSKGGEARTLPRGGQTNQLARTVYFLPRASTCSALIRRLLVALEARRNLLRVGEIGTLLDASE